MKTLQEMTIEELRNQLVFEIGLKLHGYAHSTENITALKAEIAERQYDERDSDDIDIDDSGIWENSVQDDGPA